MALDEAPPFWWKRPGPLAFLLSPIGFLWGRATAVRMSLPPDASVSVPVLCIGNFIAGGAGKTPTAIAFGKSAAARKIPFGFLSRGYGGQYKGPTVVNLKKHHAADVGDEPLLLAKHGKTVVSADRYAGASMLVAEGCKLIIMDDGFQNPSIAKDFSLVVVDAKRGTGNGFSIPAGPMRAPLAAQLAYADAVLVIGDSRAGDQIIRQVARRGKLLHTARIVPKAIRKWKGKKFFAFAGIADPDKFFISLKKAGSIVEVRRSFPDHHAYTDEEANDLVREAQSRELQLVTTSKDMARLAGVGEPQDQLISETIVFDVELEFDDPRATDLVLDATLSAAEARLLRERSG
ncbi:MAG: tetraacyldisaccharide 4'-kinase [Pseudomonadota bacterium]